MRHPVVITAALGVLLVIGYFVYKAPHSRLVSNVNSGDPAFARGLVSATDLSAALGVATAGTSSLSRPAQAGAEEYRNTRYGFSLLYPKGLKVSIFDEGDGASTVTFQNVAEVKGFQIFIVPYREGQVSMVRFRRDEPSGVMEQPTNILVGGAKATMFYSKNTALGDTIEVWVIKNGYLFEITAPKPLDVWLANIMQTWKFL